MREYLLFVFLLPLAMGCFGVEPDTLQPERPTVTQAEEHKKLNEAVEDIEAWYVKRVVDGNNLVLESAMADTQEVELKVRLIGVNCPEAGEPFAKEATDFVKQIIVSDKTQFRNKQITLEYDKTRKDKYGYTLAYVHLHLLYSLQKPDGSTYGQDVEEDYTLNEQVIVNGYSRVYTKYPFKYMEKYRALEKEAREAGKGLWAKEPEGKTSKELQEQDK